MMVRVWWTEVGDLHIWGHYIARPTEINLSIIFATSRMNSSLKLIGIPTAGICAVQQNPSRIDVKTDQEARPIDVALDLTEVTTTNS